MHVAHPAPTLDAQCAVQTHGFPFHDCQFCGTGEGDMLLLWLLGQRAFLWPHPELSSCAMTFQLASFPVIFPPVHRALSMVTIGISFQTHQFPTKLLANDTGIRLVQCLSWSCQGYRTLKLRESGWIPQPHMPSLPSLWGTRLALQRRCTMCTPNGRSPGCLPS